MGPPLEIISLEELQFNLPQEVHNHLATQYSVLDEKPSSDSDASSHLDKILGRLKTSPADTCCRVNLIKSSPEEVVEGLRNHLSKIEGQCCDYAVQQHGAIKDLVIIRAKPKDNDVDSGGTLHRCSVPPNPKCNNIFPNWPKREKTCKA